jgi:hypothetical protein
MAEQFWRIRRWREREARLLSIEDPEAAFVALTEMMPIVQRLMSAAERGFHKSLATLRQLQKDPGFVPHISENAATAEAIPLHEAVELSKAETGRIIEMPRDDMRRDHPKATVPVMQDDTGHPSAATV